MAVAKASKQPISAALTGISHLSPGAAPSTDGLILKHFLPHRSLLFIKKIFFKMWDLHLKHFKLITKVINLGFN